MKINLINRLSFWNVLASNGKKSFDIGTMMRDKDETEAQAMPRAEKLLTKWEQDKERRA